MSVHPVISDLMTRQHLTLKHKYQNADKSLHDDGFGEKFDNKEKVNLISGTDVILNMLYNNMDKSGQTFDVYADFKGPNITRDVE